MPSASFASTSSTSGPRVRVYDFDHARGRTTREQYLSKFGGQRPTDKFSALATWQLGERLRAETAPTDRVLVLGFSAGALVRADRQSASRFFWSRPLLVGFNDGTPGYGAAGLLTELTKWRPAMVALQQRDWPVEGVDSATWFSRQPALQAWLTRRIPAGGRHRHLLHLEATGPAMTVS